MYWSADSKPIHLFASSYLRCIVTVYLLLQHTSLLCDYLTRLPRSFTSFEQSPLSTDLVSYIQLAEKCFRRDSKIFFSHFSDHMPLSVLTSIAMSLSEHHWRVFDPQCIHLLVTILAALHTTHLPQEQSDGKPDKEKLRSLEDFNFSEDLTEILLLHLLVPEPRSPDEPVSF